MSLNKIPTLTEVKDWANGKFTTLNEVNNNADVPNADYADSAGDADTVDGQDASQLGAPSSTNNQNSESPYRTYINNNFSGSSVQSSNVEAPVSYVRYDAGGWDDGYLPRDFDLTVYLWGGGTVTKTITVQDSNDNPSATVSVNDYVKSVEVDAHNSDNSYSTTVEAKCMTLKNHSHSI